MAKRGRKPKERKGYFYEKEEDAIVQYITTTDEVEKNYIFNTILYPALTKMIESIIRRYKLFVPDEDFNQTFDDTISYLATKINHYKSIIIEYEEITKESEIKKNEFVEIDEEEFNNRLRDLTDNDPKYVFVKSSNEDDADDMDASASDAVIKYYKKVEKKYKAYSYCGTVCRNYVMYKCSQYTKKRNRNIPYDDVFEEISNSEKYAMDEVEYSDLSERLVFRIANEIEDMYEHPIENMLNDDEIKVGKALVNLLRNWESLLLTEGSKKLQKSTVLYFLREETMMTTKEVRDNMKKYKCAYKILKKSMIE